MTEAEHMEAMIQQQLDELAKNLKDLQNQVDSLAGSLLAAVTTTTDILRDLVD